MRANKHLLLWSSAGVLALLLAAVWAENFGQEWRRLQRRYAAALPAERQDGFAVQLRQIVVPDLDAIDRCTSCHLGLDPAETAIPGHELFGSHPPVAHEPSRYGCTICHGGQGRATVRDDAHGRVAHWPEPMLPRRYFYAGCGSCHTHLAVPRQEALKRGRLLVERFDCLACHRLEGRGGTLRPAGQGGMEGPDLSRVGATGYDGGWHQDHVRRSAAGEGVWRESFRPLADDDLALVEDYLDTRMGAPGLVEAKALFHTLGCRGCHAVNGVGGDDGPDLSEMGRRDPGQLGFGHVPGERSLAAWLAEHFRAPASVVPGSAMPAMGLTEDQIDRLVMYMLSLRQGPRAAMAWPEDRVRAVRLGEREFATDGATLYGTFCAACHGDAGQGMRYPGLPAFPAIAHPQFLRWADDEFIAETIRRGRPGRRMPAWAEGEGGLRPEEMTALVSYLRRLGGVAYRPDGRPRRWVEADPGVGAGLYAAACASCHGPDGGGGEGPALASRVLLESATDTYLVETIRRGRQGTSMAGFSQPSPLRPTLDQGEIESIVAFMRTWEESR